MRRLIDPIELKRSIVVSNTIGDGKTLEELIDEQPDANVPDINVGDMISRQAAIDALAKFVPYVIDDVSTESYTNGLTDAYNLICQLPPAQPERLTDYSFEESCTDCPAYDTENHRCPRFNQVIRMALKDANLEPCENCISRQAAIDALDEIESEVADGYGYQYEKWRKYFCGLPSAQPEIVRCKDCKLFGNSEQLPSAQPEIIRCKDCEYGEQDEVGRWFCRSLGCQIGNEDGSGYCADALNRKEGAKDD